MPIFTVEDGTGLADATSYVDIVFADDYLDDGNWAVGVPAKEKALMAATEYADVRWGNKLRGDLLLDTQALEFPRQHLFDRYGNLVEGIPDDLKKAISLYAQLSVAGTLYPVPPTDSSKEIKKEKTIVGPITTEVEFVGVATAASFLKYPLPDKFMKQYTRFATSGGGAIRN